VKVLVIGSIPPPFTPRALALLDRVLAERAVGHEVQILSPTPFSVAHRYLELSGVGSSVEIGLAVRRAERVIVQLAPGFPLGAGDGRARRAAGLGALAAALRQARGEVVIRLRSADDVAHGLGGRPALALWQVATHIEVASQVVAGQLAAVLGPEFAARIVVDEPSTSRLGGAPEDRLADESVADAGLAPERDLARATVLVRARAAGTREHVLMPSSQEVTPGPASLLPLWQWAPVPGAGVPEWAESPAAAAAQGSVARRAARAVLYAAEGQELTRPLARGVRLARKLVSRG
jgi:hypothetical protein